MYCLWKCCEAPSCAALLSPSIPAVSDECGCGSRHISDHFKEAIRSGTSARISVINRSGITCLRIPIIEIVCDTIICKIICGEVVIINIQTVSCVAVSEVIKKVRSKIQLIIQIIS